MSLVRIAKMGNHKESLADVLQALKPLSFSPFLWKPEEAQPVDMPGSAAAVEIW
jgi:hypothetical protein